MQLNKTIYTPHPTNYQPVRPSIERDMMSHSQAALNQSAAAAAAAAAVKVSSLHRCSEP